MITCRTCGQVKDDHAFHLRGDNVRRSECGTCRNASRRKPKPILRSERELVQTTGQHKAELIESGNGAIATTVSTRIKSLEQLLEACSVDLSVWKVASFTANSWESYSGQDGITTLYQVKAQLQRIKAVAVEFPEITPVRIDLPAVPASKPSIAVGMQTAVLIPDVHIGYRRDYRTGDLTPMHDESAVAVTLQLIRELQPDRVVQLGDLMDLGEFSLKWSSTPDMRFTTQASIDRAATFWGEVFNASPRSRLDWIEGNHDKRVELMVLNNTMAAYGLTQANKPDAYPVMSVPHLLGLEDLNVTYHQGYPDAELYLNPHIRCIHGTTVKQDGGETAKAVLNKSMYTHCIYGHIHRAELAYKTAHTYDGMITRFAASPGTLARLDGTVPGHSKVNNWQQGLLVAHYHTDDDQYSLEPIAINNGSMIYRGKRFTAA